MRIPKSILALAFGLLISLSLGVPQAQAALEEDGTFLGKLDGFDTSFIEVLHNHKLYRFPRSWLRNRKLELVEGILVEVQIPNFKNSDFSTWRISCRDCGPVEPASHHTRRPASDKPFRAR